ncbi:restriction endonuclease-like protein [Pectobacterium quasiaquaticum]|uniref:Restriction endonuclease-like protein n=1 Tax=Pectobacterium quasiaquaticum TaxID=2774015 RepID=A0A9Q2EUZ0_9GAMM|nr:restriction endonuclease-like protein [Pectobacterium quasiaquaticum]URG48898.1 restriction endonuclease-like protein [Pectobacterium quasiaquaticum]
MPELLRVQTEHFELSIWCNDIAKRQQVYRNTLAKRVQHADALHPSVENSVGSAVRFSPAMDLQEVAVLDEMLISETLGNAPRVQSESIALREPLFFENAQYQFEWVFFNEVEQAALTHRVRLVNEGFRFAAKKRDIPARLTGTINTGNDVGWMRLPLSYRRAGQDYRFTLAFEVLPTKMDLHRDLSEMYRVLDNNYPLWRFSLAEKTEQDAEHSKQRGDFPLLWLANFTALRQRLEQSLKIISQSPHRRLQPNVSFVRADRLKGRLPHRLTENVINDLKNGRSDKRYRVEKKYLSVDTPENRFIKMVVTQCKNRLIEFERKLRKNNQAPENQRLSDSFLTEIGSWQKPLIKMLNHSFLRDVSEFNGLAKSSLVLQQKTGYSAVYRIWQELKCYLDVFANQTSISMKSVADIYEVWCFLALRNILIDDLGFKDITPNRQALVLKNDFEYQLKNGFAGAFVFEREDGLVARLAHEPHFSPNSEDIRSYFVSHRPDIVLKVEFPTPSDKRCIWLFDAKYRIQTKASQVDGSDADKYDIDKIDLVPDDAINQMHRYRDALIRITQDTSSVAGQKSRPVFGAFALYPGFFNQNVEDNPYLDAISEVGIGAFALLPNNDGQVGCRWIVDFLKHQLGVAGNYYSTQQLQERLYLQEAARIPYYGMGQTLYPDLVMTAALGGKVGRTSTYFDNFENGTSAWYHTRVETFNAAMKKSKNHVVAEIRYLAIASTSDLDPHWKSIKKIWPVKSQKIVKRNELDVEQTGKLSVDTYDCILFELGKPLMLKTPIENVPHRPIRNSMKLTTLNALEAARQFNSVKEVYKEALPVSYVGKGEGQ